MELQHWNYFLQEDNIFSFLTGSERQRIINALYDVDGVDLLHSDMREAVWHLLLEWERLNLAKRIITQ